MQTSKRGDGGAWSAARHPGTLGRLGALGFRVLVFGLVAADHYFADQISAKAWPDKNRGPGISADSTAAHFFWQLALAIQGVTAASWDTLT